jgi:hypothetical protein
LLNEKITKINKMIVTTENKSPFFKNLLLRNKDKNKIFIPTKNMAVLSPEKKITKV